MKRILILLVLLLGVSAQAEAQNGWRVSVDGESQHVGDIDTTGDITLTGNLGVGTNTPIRIADFRRNDTAVIGNAIAYQEGAGDATFDFFRSASGVLWKIGIDATDDYFKISNDATSGDVGVDTAMAIDGSRNVTVGTLGTGADYFVCASAAGLLSESTTACAGSSARFKEDIASLSGGAPSLIDRLRPVAFRYRDDYRPDESRIGFIAEEVAELDPRLVGLNGDGEIHGLHTDGIVALLVATVQDQRDTIAALDARVAALEGR